jgi:hypothetical protein
MAMRLAPFILVWLAATAHARTTFTLTWLVHPDLPVKHPEVDYPLTPVDLVAGTERIALKPQLGALKAINQSACAGKVSIEQYPLDKGEVAKITFYEGGAGGYFVRRVAPLQLALYSWELGDGACPDAKGEPGACPRKEKKLRTIAVPAGAAIVQKLMMVDAKGKQTPYACKMD